MKYTVEESLTQFKFWSGGKDRADMLTYSELEELDSFLEDLFADRPGGAADTDINDLFWFDFKFLVEEGLGYEYDEQQDIIIRN